MGSAKPLSKIHAARTITSTYEIDWNPTSILGNPLPCSSPQLSEDDIASRIAPKLIVPSNIGFYGRLARSKSVDIDAQGKACCGLPVEAPSELAWEHWYERIHRDDRVRVEREFARLHDPRDGIFFMQYRLHGWDGIERDIIDFGRMIFEGERPRRLQGIMMDITREPRTRSAEDRIAVILQTVSTALLALGS